MIELLYLMVNHRNDCSVMNTVMHRSDCMMNRSHSVMNTVVYSVVNRNNTMMSSMVNWSYYTMMNTVMNTNSMMNSVMHTVVQTSS